jgi:hypothetical protein
MRFDLVYIKMPQLSKYINEWKTLKVLSYENKHGSKVVSIESL